MDWIILLYILFIILTGIISTIKEAQKKKINIPKKIEPYIIESEEKSLEEKIREIQIRTGADLYDIKKALEEAKGNVSKAIAILKEQGLIIKEEERLKTPKRLKPEKEEIVSSLKLKEEKTFIFLEKDLKEKLPEAIILMEILGPPKAFRGFGPPYRQKFR